MSSSEEEQLLLLLALQCTRKKERRNWVQPISDQSEEVTEPMQAVLPTDATNRRCARRSIAHSGTNQEKKKKTEGKKEETANRQETSSWKRSNRLLASSSSQGAKNTNSSSQGKSSQHCAASLRNNYSPDIQTPKTEIKEEIEVDEDQWKLQPQPIKEELTDDVEWVSDSSEQVKMEPKEEEEELEPVASVTIPSITEDLFEEEY